MTTCLNCTRQAVPNDDFCEVCLAKVEEMVDVHDLSDNRVDMAVSGNPFYSQGRMTGKIRTAADPSISSQVERDDDDNSNYWFVIIFILAVLALMINLYL